MAEMTITVQFALVFEDATTRTIKFNNVSEDAIGDVKEKLVALNDDMPAAFASTFVSNDGASCILIKNGKIIVSEEEELYNANS